MGKASGKSLKQEWANRIVGYDEVEAEALTANPLNFRLHPPAQQAALRGILDNIGFVQSVIVNKRTGLIVDGHLRVEMARKRGGKVPVVYVDLTEDEEKAVLASLDPIGAMANKDTEKLHELLTGLSATEEIEGLLHSLHSKDVFPFNPEEEYELQPEKADDSVFSLNNDPVFASEHKWGIPDLRQDMLSSHVPRQTWPDNRYNEDEVEWYFDYSTCGIKQATGKTVGFNNSDWRFETLWRDIPAFTAKMLAIQPRALVAPDFSAWANDPLVVQVYAQYRKLWAARYFQEAGLFVVPQVNPPASEASAREWEFAGVPHKPPVILMQCRTLSNDAGKRLFLRGLALVAEILEPACICIYGGVDNHKWLNHNMPKSTEIVLLASWQWLRQNYLIQRKGGARREAGAS